jgi:multidrug efflux system membrane fusion protein
MGATQSIGVAKHPKRHRTRWILIVVALVLVALVVFHVLNNKKPTRGSVPQAVKVAQATSGDMPETLMELGTVTPIATVTVLPQLSGYLTEVAYREGQDVTKGQFLAQIDPRQYQIDLQQAQAQLLKDQAALGQARSDLARYEQLRGQTAIAEQTVTDQEFTVKQDEAQVETDEANIAQYKLDLIYCHITAPVAGRVGLRLVDPGNYVTASSSTGIVVITTIKPTTVQFTIAQNDLDKVVKRFNTADAKLPVTAYSSDNSRQIATGDLYALSNQMTTSTGTVTLRATFANDDEALFPNEFVNIKMLVDTLHQVVLVPTAAVLTGAPGDYVYLVDPPGSRAKSGDKSKDSEAKKDDAGTGKKAAQTVSVRKVVLGPSDGRNTAILSGLAVGDTVVTDGTDRLSDGAEVSISKPGTGAAEGASPASGKKKPPDPSAQGASTTTQN